MCNSEFDNFNGCHGICLHRPFELNILTDFFEDHKCNNLLQTGELYPAMCKKHCKDFNMIQTWDNMPNTIKSIVYYITNPQDCPLIFFELFIMSKFIPWRMVVKILLEPLCFWIINEEHFAITILFGYRFLGNKSLEDGNIEFLESDSKFTYAYVLDSICQILPWIMNGEEDLQALQMSSDELIAIKWLKITQMILHGFMLCFGANGMPRQIPNFIPEWQDVWRTRFKYWIDLHLLNNMLDNSEAEQSWVYFEGLLTHVRICASFAVNNPRSEESIQNLYQRLIEYEEDFAEKQSL